MFFGFKNIGRGVDYLGKRGRQSARNGIGLWISWCLTSFLDRTRGRQSTFFGRGLVAHITFAHPVCRILSRLAAESIKAVDATTHEGGTYVCMEGPQFSTLAESNLYRSWGMDIIGMTNLQEAKLAREAEICYVTLALVTDYDCWHPDHGPCHGRDDCEELDSERRNGPACDSSPCGRATG